MDIRSSIYKFCNYQERSQQEVRNKLYDLGADTEQVNELIAQLIESELINEERFARAFVRGKFRIKKWGKVKINYELKVHRLSEYVLKKAFMEIDPSDYYQTAKEIAEKKWLQLKTEKSEKLRANKVYQYLKQKGYEYSVIIEVTAELRSLT